MKTVIYKNGKQIAQFENPITALAHLDYLQSIRRLDDLEITLDVDDSKCVELRYQVSAFYPDLIIPVAKFRSATYAKIFVNTRSILTTCFHKIIKDGEFV